MKRLVLCLLLGMASASLAAETVDSRITQVTLFSNQALVRRDAEATVQAGLNEILLDVEAFHIDPDSVTAKVFGHGEIFSVQYKQIPVQEAPQDNIRILEQKISDRKRSRQALLDQQQALQRQETFLNSFIDFAKTQIPRDIQTDMPDLADLEKTLSFLNTNYQKIFEKNEALNASVENLDQEIRVLEQELDALRVTSRKVRNVIEILFNAEKPQKIKLQASYLSRNAGWQPLYKVAVPTDLKDIQLTLFARVVQKTGEDWSQVSLSISNVIPLSGARLPALSSWVLDLPRPVPRATGRTADLALQKAAPSTEAGAPQAESEAAQEAGFVEAQRRQLPLSFEYTITQPMTVESRDKETILPLLTKTLAGDFNYFSVPKQSPLTFLVARAEADKELLAGPLNVYFGGQYVAKTILEEKKAGDEFKLNLGADREVAVKREKVKDTVKETFFGKIERDTIVRELAYKITAENLKDTAVQMSVLDAVPVARTDKIEVSDLRITPEPTERNYLDQEGVMRWQVKLGPAASQEIRIEFVVKYPKDVPIGF